MRATILGGVLVAGGLVGIKWLELPPWAAIAVMVLGALIVEPAIVKDGLKAIGTFVERVRG